ncbi:tetratricopeptide repeat-containing sensor histidine kinase [Marinirhabdus gelatinilytica]|uniref:Oxygen sensor histidine kinase NreB n=1 Tax=Marinirhabdus gelatinilytica TaxID=1703343 RepID=A0A370QLR5_9FLAO|nr:sensor histidine kinase [Marinirhabdus gelatinilytica]RDK89317.1 histidine kinase/DNA gyrase B/HSP90-like ATPase [Marinirhabdus gelatinilytica]
MYILFGLTLLFLGQPKFLFAQEFGKEKIDKVLETILNSPEEEKKRHLYFKLGDSIVRKNSPEQATPLFKYIFKKDTTDFAKLILYEAYSRNLSRSGFLDEAIALKKKAIQLSDKFNMEKRYIFFHYSLAYSLDQINQPDSALAYLNKVEELILKEENRVLLPNYYDAKAAVYNSLKEYDKQEQYLLKIYELVKDWENTSQKRFHLYIILDFYTQVDKPQQLAKFTQILAEHYEEAHVNTPAGHMPIEALFKRRLSKENIPLLQKAINISDSIQSMNSYAYTTIALANLYEANGNPEKGIPYLKNAVERLQTVQKPSHLIDIFTTLAKMSAAANNYKDAYTYKILQGSLQDSVTSERMKKNIAALEIEFETEKKERKILSQQLELEKQTRQKNMTRYGLIALAVVAVMLLLFFRYRLQSQKTIAAQTHAIQQQRITELQQKNKLLALNSMIEGQEAERLRIAKDLHDSLGGLLSTVKAHFTTIQNEFKQVERINLADKTNKLIDEAVVEVRRISHNMMPQALSISGLQGAVEDLGLQLQQEGYETKVEIIDYPKNVDATKEVMLYRLLQELLSNIRKHSEASEVTIQLLGHNNELTILVEDNGKGFNYKEQLEKGGLGLKSINSRAQFLDGTIDWDSQIGQGTSVTVKIPI